MGPAGGAWVLFLHFRAFLCFLWPLLQVQDGTSAMTTSNASRSAGILLHPTSLPGQYGIGDLGESAYRWIDKLAQAKQTWWQMLPLNPTGLGDSPYSSFSAFAGNPLLVSPDA